MSEPLLVSMAETARLLGVCKVTVYSMIRAGTLRSVLLGRRRMIPRAQLDKFVKRDHPIPDREVAT